MRQEGGQERQERQERQGSETVPLVPIGRVARVRGQPASPPRSQHPPGGCTSIAPRRIDNKHPHYLKTTKTHQDVLEPLDFSWTIFRDFLRVVVCSRQSWAGWPQWVVGSLVGIPGQRLASHRQPRRRQPGLYRGWHACHPGWQPASPQHRDKQPTGPAGDAAWPARNVCIGSPPVACLVYLFTIGCHHATGPAGLAWMGPVNNTIQPRGPRPLNKASQW